MTRNSRSTKKILVTGGAGFLGSHLIDRLLARGDQVLCVDNLYTGSKANIEHIVDHPDFEFILHDVCTPLDLEVDEIYNLACPASPAHYQSDSIQTTKTSVLGALNVLELGQKLGCKVFQASTSEVYGDPLVHPQKESYWGHVNPIGPRSCYDEGKRCAETLFFDFYRQHGVQVKVARIFNTYGPRMHVSDGRVVSNFIVQALAGDPISIYGDGSQTRSFCFVSDLVSGFVNFMDTDETVIGPINIGNPVEFTVRELAEKIIVKTGSRSNLIHLPLPEDDPKQRQPDISKAAQFLDWAPMVGLDEGLDMTIAYYRELLA